MGKKFKDSFIIAKVPLALDALTYWTHPDLRYGGKASNSLKELSFAKIEWVGKKMGWDGMG